MNTSWFPRSLEHRRSVINVKLLIGREIRGNFHTKNILPPTSGNYFWDPPYSGSICDFRFLREGWFRGLVATFQTLPLSEVDIGKFGQN